VTADIAGDRQRQQVIDVGLACARSSRECSRQARDQYRQRLTWIRSQDPVRIGGALRDRFLRSYAEGSLLTPAASAAMLLDHLRGPDGERTGAIWDLAETV
jgi:hypothetical protein